MNLISGFAKSPSNPGAVGITMITRNFCFSLCARIIRFTITFKKDETLQQKKKRVLFKIFNQHTSPILF